MTFSLYAPRANSVNVLLLPGRTATPLERRDDGTFEGDVPGARPGMDYLFQIEVDGKRVERPDPASLWQPEGVHGPSRIYDPASFRWTDAGWKGIALDDYLIYELHIGTFTPGGTFESAVEKLPYLRDLGVTAVEIMPVAEFPGGRNWGYDGAYLYAAQSTYGGPSGLQRLVDACHAHGLAVVLDVVYNHLGPEGNYIGEYSPFFTDRYRTPWGGAINYDDADSDGVRRFVVENALHWLERFHVDALRLDAIHGIFDFSARHILEEIAEEFQAAAGRLGREAYLIAESDLNDTRVTRPPDEGGWDLDGVWSDDFHHAVHAALTGDRRGYYTDFGRASDIAKAIREGFVYDGRHSAFRRRRHGMSSAGRPGREHVVCLQNHDQVANGSAGARIAALLPPEACKVAAALMFFAPNIPMLFMGEEWGETNPFLYFTSHGDPGLAKAVSEGRMAEFKDFVQPGESPSDPQDEETFRRSRLDWSKLERRPHRDLLNGYRELIALRRELPCLRNCRKDLVRVEVDDRLQWIRIERHDPGGSAARLTCTLTPGAARAEIELRKDGEWRPLS